MKGLCKKRVGFTLIELLVVIAIIGLLMAILVPGLKNAKELTKRVVCAAGLRQVGVAMSSYAESYPLLPDAEGVEHGYAVYRDDKVDSNLKPIPLRWAKLYEAGYMDTPEIFYCPGNRMDLFKYESYSNPEPWGFLPQNYNTLDPDGGTHNQWIRVGYTYLPVPAGKTKWDKNGRLVLAEKVVQLNPNMPYATDVLHRRGVLSHQRSKDGEDDTYRESNKYSVNAVYSDAHVANCNDPDVFKDPVWDNFQSDYERSYLTVFQLIGVE